jgi:hypothetical protein
LYATGFMQRHTTSIILPEAASSEMYVRKAEGNIRQYGVRGAIPNVFAGLPSYNVSTKSFMDVWPVASRISEKQLKYQTLARIWAVRDDPLIVEFPPAVTVCDMTLRQDLLHSH